MKNIYVIIISLIIFVVFTSGCDNNLSIKSDQITGYWGDIYVGYDGVAHLNGYYFDEDGTGLMFHSAEGAFSITSYSISEDILSYTFLNMDEEPVEWSYRVLAISENQIVLENDGSDKLFCYERMEKIESTSCMGSYTITRMDGTTLGIQGY